MGLPPENLKLHCVCKDNNRNTNRSTDLTLRPTQNLFEKHVHMSHVLLQSITNSATCLHKVLKFPLSTQIHPKQQRLNKNLLKTFTSLELRLYHYIRANHTNKTVYKR
jgi:hypothetical protein